MDMRRNLDNLMVRGTLQGNLPDPTNSILVMSTRNVWKAETFFWGYMLQVVIGSRYLAGFVRTDTAQAWWLEDKVAGGQDSVATLGGVARCHL